MHDLDRLLSLNEQGALLQKLTADPRAVIIEEPTRAADDTSGFESLFSDGKSENSILCC